MCGSPRACIVCHDTISKNAPAVLACNCSVCRNCVLQWCLVKSNDIFCNGKTRILCPNENCGLSFELQTVIPTLTAKQQEQLNFNLLKNYCRESDDIVQCRNGICNYYGFVGTETCLEPLECLRCGHRWRNKNNLTLIQTLLYLIQHFQTEYTNLQSEVYAYLWTASCPSCGIYIRKVGGCDHMTCKKCSYEFCWICKHEYKTHSLSYCAANVVSKILVYGFIAFHLGYLMNLYFAFWQLLRLFILWTMKILFFNFTYIVIFLLIFPLLCICKERESIMDKPGKFFTYCGAFGLMLYITWWDLRLVFIHYGKEFVWTCVVEGAILSVVSIVDHVNHSWMKYVFWIY